MPVSHSVRAQGIYSTNATRYQQATAYMQSAFDLSVMSKLYVDFLVQAQSYQIEGFFDGCILLSHSIGLAPKHASLRVWCKPRGSAVNEIVVNTR